MNYRISFAKHGWARQALANALKNAVKKGEIPDIYYSKNTNALALEGLPKSDVTYKKTIKVKQVKQVKETKDISFFDKFIGAVDSLGLSDRSNDERQVVTITHTPASVYSILFHLMVPYLSV